MSSIAIIPARGGSKRIPKKNIKEFLGRPILEYSIKAAFESGLFDEVMVSTDNKQIAEIAKSLGASVPFMRSSVNSNDFATTINVIEEVVGRYKKLNANFEYGCCLYPSAPFTTGVVLKRFYKFLTASNFDCVFPVLKYGHPIQRWKSVV